MILSNLIVVSSSSLSPHPYPPSPPLTSDDEAAYMYRSTTSAMQWDARLPTGWREDYALISVAFGAQARGARGEEEVGAENSSPTPVRPLSSLAPSPSTPLPPPFFPSVLWKVHACKLLAGTRGGGWAHQYTDSRPYERAGNRRL